MPSLFEHFTLELHALTEVSIPIPSKFELSQCLEAIMDKIIGVMEPEEVAAVIYWDQSVF